MAETLALGPRDTYIYKCEKCHRTKIVRITGEGRKYFVHTPESMCNWFGCYGRAVLVSVEKGPDATPSPQEG